MRATSLIGREDDLERVASVLAQGDARIVTLTGAGGSGKTSLAIELAWRLAERFADGVVFVEMARVVDPDLALEAVVTALGIREMVGGSLETLVTHLSSREMLIVIDNFEQLVAAGRSLAEIVRRTSGVRFLVTSRTPLKLYGEREIAASPLAVPDARAPCTVASAMASSAVQLFVERARAVQPSFAVTPENCAAIVAICAAVDGLPLALELAAARVKHLPVTALHARLGERLKWLTGGARDMPERHQTLRATLDWSHSLLGAEEQRTFARLGAFRGDFDVAAIAAVLGVDELEAVDALASLVDQSLLVRREGEVLRVRMLETVREYAADRLAAEADAARVRFAHASHYAAVADACAADLSGPKQIAALRALEAEQDNAREALAWALDAGEFALAERLGAAYGAFWLVRSRYEEGRRMLGKLQATLADAGTARGTRAIDSLARIALYVGDYALMHTALDAIAARSERLGDRQAEARGVGLGGFVAMLEGKRGDARAWTERALGLARATGDPATIADVLAMSALVLRDERAHDEAAARWDEALSIARSLGDVAAIARALMNRGHVAYRQRDLALARTLFLEALGLYGELENRGFAAECVEGLSAVLAQTGQPRRAGRLWAAARALATAVLAATDPEMRTEYEAAVANALSELGPETSDEVLAEGRAISFAELLSEARIETPPPPRETASDTEALLRELARAPDVQPLPAPRHGVEVRLGRFEIRSPLDEGGMGYVYVARDTALGRDVAIKLLRPRAGDPAVEGHARLLREARAAAALNHPNVAAIYDVGEHEGTPFIAMELVEGRSLRRVLAEGAAAIPWRTRLAWLVDVAGALHAAHEAGIVHRDVKPENVVVRDDGVVKVVVFGIARHATSATAEVPTLTADGARVGTPLYMAPEQIEGRPIDGRADQFAWAVMAYELFTGERPWPRVDDRSAQLAMILAAPPRAPRLHAGIPSKVARVLVRALEKTPDDRFASMREAAAALGEATRRARRRPT